MFSLRKELKDRFVFIILSFFAIYTAFFTILTIRMYDTFYFFDFDLAVNNQVLWTTLHGRPFWTSIFGYNLFGDHVSPIFLLILPFYALVPDARLLLFIQSLVLGAGVIPIYVLAKREIGAVYGTIFSFVYILFPALIYMNLFEFHPIALSTTLLLFAFMFLHERKFSAYAIFLALSLFTREDMALVVIMFGVYALLKKMDRKWVLFPILFGIFWAVFTIGFLMPHLAPKGFLHYERYTHLGGSPKEMILTIINKPLFVLSYMFSLGKVKYLIELFSSLGFLPLLSPLELLFTAPVFALNLLSSWGSQQTLGYHYNAQIIPFLFIAAIFSLKKIKNAMEKTSLGKWWKAWGIFIFAFSFGSCLVLSPIPKILFEPSFYTFDKKDEARQTMLSLVPPEAPVMATFNFLPRLSHRMNVYSYHHWYMRGCTGRYEGSLDEVGYILIDFDDFYMNYAFGSREGDMRQKELLKDPTWGIVSLSDDMVLLKRGFKSPYTIIDVYEMFMKDEVGQANFTAALWLKGNTNGEDVFYATTVSSYVQYASEISGRFFLNYSQDPAIEKELSSIELPENFGEEVFVETLKKYEVSYIYIFHKFGESEVVVKGTGKRTVFSKPKIIASRPDLFELVYENEFVRIYRVKYTKAFHVTS